MSFFKRLFGKGKESEKKVEAASQAPSSSVPVIPPAVPPVNYQAFWDWFVANEKRFSTLMKDQNRVQEEVLQPIFEKLQEIREDLFVLAGWEENVVDVIFSTDGVIESIPFAEELVRFAPKVEGWKFSALKQPAENPDFYVEMGPHKFGPDTLKIYPQNDPSLPDEIGLYVFYEAWEEGIGDAIYNGVMIYLTTLIGERDYLLVDDLRVGGSPMEGVEAIPLEELRNYLIWREKEFSEREKEFLTYEDDTFSMGQGVSREGLPILFLINQKALGWKGRTAFPWIHMIEIKFNNPNEQGMPGNQEHDLSFQFEEELTKILKSGNDLIYLYRRTGEGGRAIFLAGSDFRETVLKIDPLLRQFSAVFEVSLVVVRDKYWQLMEAFEG